jgi:hypothetical protein
MTKLTKAVSEEDRVMVITNLVLTYCNKMAARIHRSLKIIEFNANNSWRQRYELIKQLQNFV